MGEALELAVLWRDDRDPEDCVALLHKVRLCLGETIRLAACPTYGPTGRVSLEMASAVAEKGNAPLMAVNDVLYHGPERRRRQDVATAIRLHTPVAEAGHDLLPNAI